MADTKGHSLLTLAPGQEINFNGPFTDVSTSYLKLTNNNQKAVAFKVKTTAPKQYCVRPNSGVIAPGQTHTVSVMLQPIDINATETKQHKFMVQSVYAPSGDLDLDSFWKSVPSTEIHFAKLRVTFDQVAAAAAVKVDQQPASPPVRSSGDYVDESIVHSTTSPSVYSSVSNSESDRTKKLEQEVERLNRERAELLFKVQAATSRASAQASEFPLPMVQIGLIILAGILLGLIVGKLF